MLPILINPWVMILWVAASTLIGLLGKDKRFGFFGNFIVALLFTPIVGALVLLASDDKKDMPRSGRNRY